MNDFRAKMFSGFALAVSILVIVQGRTIDEIIKESITDSTSGFSPIMPDGGLLTELDVVLRPEQYEERMKDQESSTGDRSKRKAIPHEYRRWTDNTMPYSVGAGFNSVAMDNLHSAMREWEEHTCVKFRPATAFDRNYVSIQNGEGCNSYVGMQSYSPQVMNLGAGCKVHSVSLHEIGHALGLHHEQNRQDRDDYVWVRLDYMDPYYQFASKKENAWNIDNYGVPYDYSSIMHYGGTAFGISSEPTMITHNPSWQTRIGTAQHLSFKDIKIMNIMYNCGGHCGSKSCPGDGFLDKNCQCICPGNPTSVCGTPVQEVDPCVDLHPSCDYWAQVGECQRNPGYMEGNCARACGVCGPACKDDMSDCQTRAYNGDCKINPVLMFDKCKKSCGICYGKDHENNCHDTNASCAYWASLGECNANPNYMRHNCKRSCASC